MPKPKYDCKPLHMVTIKSRLQHDCYKPTFVPIWRLTLEICLTLTLIGAPFVAFSNFGLIPSLGASLLSGIGFLRCWLIAHEASHRRLSRNSLINNLIGNIFAIPTLYPFTALSKAHKHHHIFLSTKGIDTTWNPWTRAEWRSKNIILRTLYLLVRTHFWFLGSLFHLVVYHFVTEKIRLRNSAKIITQKVLSLAVLLAAAIETILDPLFSFCVFIVPYLVFHALLSTISYIQHTFPAQQNNEGKCWHLDALSELKIEEISKKTIDWRFGHLFEFLIMNINRHSVHHAFPQISFDKLPTISEKMKQIGSIDERKFTLGSIYLVIKNCVFFSEIKEQNNSGWEST